MAEQLQQQPAMMAEHGPIAGLYQQAHWLAGLTAQQALQAGFPLLHWACASGNVELAQELLAQGANPDEAEPNFGLRPLLVAAACGHVAVVQLLADGVELAQAHGQHVEPPQPPPPPQQGQQLEQLQQQEQLPAGPAPLAAPWLPQQQAQAIAAGALQQALQQAAPAEDPGQGPAEALQGDFWQRIDEHRLCVGRLHSEGAFGRVWLGSYGEMEVVIKEARAVEGAARALTQEARVYQHLQQGGVHDRIARCLGGVRPRKGCNGRRLVLVRYHTNLMEFMGPRHNPQLDGPRRWALALQLCEALQFLHDDRRVVHRDLKPDNILLDKDLNVKVCDFGLSQTLPAQLHQPPGSQQMEGDALIFNPTHRGSPLFMAPELWKAEPFGVRADIWAYGVMLYQLVTWQDNRLFLEVPDDLRVRLAAVYEGRQRNVPRIVPWDEWHLQQQGLRSLLQGTIADEPGQRPSARSIHIVLKQLQPQSFVQPIARIPAAAPLVRAAAPQPAASPVPTQATAARWASVAAAVAMVALLLAMGSQVLYASVVVRCRQLDLSADVGAGAYESYPAAAALLLTCSLDPAQHGMAVGSAAAIAAVLLSLLGLARRVFLQ